MCADSSAKIFAITALVVSAVAAAPAQRVKPPVTRDTAPALQLTVDSIMRGPRLVGYQPSGLRWSGDSRELYFEWRLPDDEKTATYVVTRDGTPPRRLTDEERKQAPPPAGQWDRNQARVLFVDEGDIVLVDTVARKRVQVTRTAGDEANPRWTRNETHITFTRSNSLFIVPVASPAARAAAGGGDENVLVQLTDASPKVPEPLLTDSQKFLKEEEKKLIDYVRQQEEKTKKEEERKKRGALPHIELEEGQSISDLALSPDGLHVFFLVVDEAVKANRADVPNYVTESTYPEMIETRSRVGDVQDRSRLGILHLRDGTQVWATDGFAPRRADTALLGKENPLAAVRWTMPLFSDDGGYAVAVVRGDDNKDRWIVGVDWNTGEARVLDHVHDAAWVREIQGGGPAGIEETGWLPDNRFWFLSERDGWMHLYTVDVSADALQPKPLTTGRFEIDEVELSADRKSFYVTSTEQHPGERHIYKLPVDGGARTKMTGMTGAHEGRASPDQALLAFVYSYSNKPPELYLMPNQPGAEARQVTTSPVPEWLSFRWRDPQLVTFAARDGATVHARLYTPEMFGVRRESSAPGVVFVHGAGYLQNAHRYWSYYYREYMFHNLLASRGYVVIDADYRGSAGYGRDWRTAIYRHMGGKDLDDVVDAANYLVGRQKVDPKRIGLYGGSYGGFITLMAMFTSPDTFSAGAALRPVTDWAHYSHEYTSNILNAPQSDAEAYRRSSPIYFADRLKGALLICHGMVDTNVHFQDSVRLAQRLIELRKENWELAAYPAENHAFEQESSWADEYKRILKLFETYLRKSGSS